MTKVRVRSLLHLLLAALAIVAITTATPAFAKSKKKKAPPTAPSKQQAKFEKDFLKKMMDRHQRGIKLAQWVDANTTYVQLNAFCQNFIAREQDEMTSMSQMLQSWYGITYTPKNKSVSGDDIEDVEDADNPLEAAIEALGSLKGYDSNELAQMKQPKKKAFHTVLKDFAASLSSIDKAEISYIKDWCKQIEKQLDEEEDDDDDDDDDEDDD